MKLIFSALMALAYANDSERTIQIDVYDASEKGKVVLMVTVDGCTTKFLAKLEDLKDKKKLGVIADKAVDRANNGCTN